MSEDEVVKDAMLAVLNTYLDARCECRVRAGMRQKDCPVWEKHQGAAKEADRIANERSKKEKA
jgi:hypothetical protein